MLMARAFLTHSQGASYTRGRPAGLSWAQWADGPRSRQREWADALAYYVA